MAWAAICTRSRPSSRGHPKHYRVAFEVAVHRPGALLLAEAKGHGPASPGAAEGMKIPPQGVYRGEVALRDYASGTSSAVAVLQ
jgi:hypothetical protein